MLDANGTRHHLLLGEADWKRCTCAAQKDLREEEWGKLMENPHSPIQWHADSQAVRLHAESFRFTAPALDSKPDLERQRRGAAADAFGNWYWIDDSGQRIRVWPECTVASDFWPPAETETTPPSGGFAPVSEAPASQPLSLAGIAVNSEHFLVVGTLAPAGVLIFDLAAGGAPMHLLWPADAPFKPFDMAAGPDGSVWILDRRKEDKKSEPSYCWVLDRHFNIMSFAPESNTTGNGKQQTGFGPAKGGASLTRASRMLKPDSALKLDDAKDPISIEVLDDGTLLVLDRATSGKQDSRILAYREGKPLLDESKTRVEWELKVSLPGDAESKPQTLPLAAYDFAVVRKGKNALPVDIYVVEQEGNQTYLFTLDQDKEQHWKFESKAGYWPMRRFGGRGLVALKDKVYYDFAESWVPLMEETRPRYKEEGVLRTWALDGKEPDCVWHRLMLDACVPSEASLCVWTRCSNDKELLEQTEWLKEPSPYLRRTGSELPYLRSPWAGAQAHGEGTWELLFQHARGRYLQIAIGFNGNQRVTPSLRALRAYYPRFSYLNQYMPALYREDAQSAHFLDGFLANIEGFYTGIEDRIAAVQALFDWRAAPPEALEWLAEWFGAALDPSWDEHRRRLFIKHAMRLFAYRGTAHGLRLALALALDPNPDERLFDEPGAVCERRFNVRIIEKYLARRLPDVLLGDPSQLEADSLLNPVIPWKPAEGRAALNLRYAQALGKKDTEAHGIELPLVQPDDQEEAGKWALFTEINLGFTPYGGTLERESWQAAVKEEYSTINACNKAWFTSYKDFDEIAQPVSFPPEGEQRDLWVSHMHNPSPARTPIERLQWQDFLRSRYGAISALNKAWNKNWTGYDLVPFPDALPANDAAMRDWLQFEGGVLAIRGAAHRFSVLLPMPAGNEVDPEEAHRRLELARRIVALEKPAHTTFDVRFYWAMFRVGEARLGLDTCIETGIRERLIPPMVLGRGYIGASLVAPTAAESRRDRSVLGRERITH